MSNYTGAVPDVLDHGRDWLEKAVCKADPDAMHPDNNEAGIDRAKRICGPCPVWMTCLQDALRTGDNEWGIRGGLRPNERRAVSKRLSAQQYGDPEAIASAVQHVLHPSLERTLQDLWEQHTYPLPDGHLGWRGNPTPRYQGKNCSPRRIAFLHDRGREPVGFVRGACDVDGCVHPQHVADQKERDEQRAQALEAGVP